MIKYFSIFLFIGSVIAGPTPTPSGGGGSSSTGTAVTNIIDATDIVLGTVYTNSSGSNLVVSCSLTLAASAVVTLKIDNNADGAYETTRPIYSTASNSPLISGNINPGGVYLFEKTSGTSSVNAGSCQRVYSPATQVMVPSLATIDASQITSGTVPLARMDTNVVQFPSSLTSLTNYLNQTNNFVIDQFLPNNNNPDHLIPYKGICTWPAGLYLVESNCLMWLDSMFTNGLSNYGWKWLLIDDGWAQTGTMNYDTNAFPRGIKYVVDYAHARGMKVGLGINLSPTNQAGAAIMRAGDMVQWYGSTLPSWGIDQIKGGGMYISGSSLSYDQSALLMMSLWYNSGRDLPWLHSFNYSSDYPNVRLQQVASSIHYNVHPGEPDTDGTWTNEMEHLDWRIPYRYQTRPGHFVDNDFLRKDGGSHHMTFDEYRSGLDLRAMMCYPIELEGVGLSWGVPGGYFGTALVANGYYELQYLMLTNVAWLAVQEDKWQKAADPIFTNGTYVDYTSECVQAFTKPLSDGSTEVMLLNRSNSAVDVSFSTTNTYLFPPFTVMDTHMSGSHPVFYQYITNRSQVITYSNVPAHGSAMLNIRRGKVSPLQTGTNYLGAWWSYDSTNGFDGDTFMYYTAFSPDKAFNSSALTINGTTYPKGIAAAVPFQLHYAPGGFATTFHCEYGVDNSTPTTTNAFGFFVYTNGVLAFSTNGLARNVNAKSLDIPMVGVNDVIFVGTNASPYPRFDIVNAYFYANPVSQ